MDTVRAVPGAGTETATVTFLFTDIEGSTRLWEAHPGAMGGIVERHDSLVGDVVARFGGRVFKTVGDASCAAFASAPAALAAAIAIQQELSQLTTPDREPLRVRMGLHTGEAQLRDGDYFGPALSRVARILSVGHGGQVLMSLATAELVREALPKEVELGDLGLHRLKDLQRPERIFQALHPSLAREFPPLRSLSELPNNLPQQVSSFVGREKELADVAHLLEKSRLVTLTGAGGTGKTRLALQVAAEHLHQFPEGAWLGDLSGERDAGLVALAVCRAVGIREAPGREALDLLVDAVRARTALILLDNCEHVLEQAALLAERLLRDCPGVKVLTTSREALRIEGETVYPVPPLALPGGGASSKASTAMNFDSVRLFSERARSVRPSFELSDSNVPFVVEICRRLDGIPLAIELAAARVSALPVEQIAARLDDRFRLLTGGSRTAMPRQQTLRALIEWSYSLLEEEEKELFRRLSVFSGGWSLEAALAVCPDSPDARARGSKGPFALDSHQIVDALDSLVRKSLAYFDESKGGSGRYGFLESVRQFAREELERGKEGTRGEASQLVEDLLSRHAHYYLGVAEEAARHLTGQGQLQWLEILDHETENMRSALECCRSRPAMLETGLRIAGRLGRYWMIRGSVREGLAFLGPLLSQASAEGGVARQDLEAARAGALISQGWLYWQANDLAASRAAFESSLKINQRLGDDAARAAVYSHLAVVAIASMDLDRALDWITAALGLNQKLGNTHGVASSLGALGNVLEKRGELQKAAQRYTESLEFWKQLGNQHAMAVFLNNLGGLARKQGDFDAAQSYARESLSLRKALGDRLGALWSIEAFAKLHQARGDSERAARLLGAADALRMSLGMPVQAVDRQELEETADQARAGLGAERFEQAWNEGAELSLEEVIEVCLLPDASA